MSLLSCRPPCAMSMLLRALPSRGAQPSPHSLPFSQNMRKCGCLSLLSVWFFTAVVGLSRFRAFALSFVDIRNCLTVFVVVLLGNSTAEGCPPHWAESCSAHCCEIDHFFFCNSYPSIHRLAYPYLKKIKKHVSPWLHWPLLKKMQVGGVPIITGLAFVDLSILDLEAGRPVGLPGWTHSFPCAFCRSC